MATGDKITPKAVNDIPVGGTALFWGWHLKRTVEQVCQKVTPPAPEPIFSNQVTVSPWILSYEWVRRGWRFYWEVMKHRTSTN